MPLHIVRAIVDIFRLFMHIDTSLLDHFAIVLVNPKFAENIGAAARIAYNMGLSRLIIVRNSMPDHETMAKMATHKAAHLLDTMEVHATLEQALAPFSIVIGTTARRGRQRLLEKNPRTVVEDLLPQIVSNQIAFVFGPENYGLSNDDLKYCQMTSAIPTADFSSLNLAQAVAIHCYELYYGVIHAQKDMKPSPQYASTFELEGMYSHIESVLLQINFLHEKSHLYWMNNIRQFLNRMRLTSKDSNILRGICRQFLWHQSHTDAKQSQEDNPT
jgi:tRNA/rRNA methyltransferase